MTKHRLIALNGVIGSAVEQSNGKYQPAIYQLDSCECVVNHHVWPGIEFDTWDEAAMFADGQITEAFRSAQAIIDAWPIVKGNGDD